MIWHKPCLDFFELKQFRFSTDMKNLTRNRLVVQLITINAEIKTYEVLEVVLNTIASSDGGFLSTSLYYRTLQMFWSFFLLCFIHLYPQRCHKCSFDILLLCLLQYSYQSFGSEIDLIEGKSSITPLLKIALTLLIAKETKFIFRMMSSDWKSSSHLHPDNFHSDNVKEASRDACYAYDDWENFAEQPTEYTLSETEIKEFYSGIPMISDGESKSLPENSPFDKRMEIDPYQIKYPKSKNSSCTYTEGYYGILKPGILCYPQPRPTREVTIKTPKPTLNKRDFKRFLKEVKTIIYVGHHDNVAGIIGAWTREISHGNLLVIMEHCELGSMYEYLQSNMLKLEGKKSILMSVHRWLYEIASGLYFLHCRNIVHGSLCTRRILLTKYLTVKLTEFGVAPHMFSRTNPFEEQLNNEVLWPWRNLSYETLTANKSKKLSDSWSFAITSWEILTLGSIPFAAYSHFDARFLEALKSGLQVQFPKITNNSLRDLFSQCLKLNYINRPTSKNILRVMYDLTKPKRRKLSFCVHPEFRI